MTDQQSAGGNSLADRMECSPGIDKVLRDGGWPPADEPSARFAKALKSDPLLWLYTGLKWGAVAGAFLAMLYGAIMLLAPFAIKGANGSEASTQERIKQLEDELTKERLARADLASSLAVLRTKSDMQVAMNETFRADIQKIANDASGKATKEYVTAELARSDKRIHTIIEDEIAKASERIEMRTKEEMNERDTRLKTYLKSESDRLEMQIKDLKRDVSQQKTDQDTKNLAGRWNVVKVQQEGMAEDSKVDLSIFFGEKNQFEISHKGETHVKGGYIIDASEKPRQLTLTCEERKYLPHLDLEKTTLGIYELDGDKLRILLRTDGKRPASFMDHGNPKQVMLVLERQKKEKPEP